MRKIVAFWLISQACLFNTWAANTVQEDSLLQEEERLSNEEMADDLTFIDSECAEDEETEAED